MMQRIFIAGHRFDHLVPLHRHADDGHRADLAFVERGVIDAQGVRSGSRIHRTIENMAPMTTRAEAKRWQPSVA
jgi:hypothetical protein